jgi:hypothetical protein
MGASRQAIFDNPGFRWDRSALSFTRSAHSTERVCLHFRYMLKEFARNADVLEGAPFTFQEVKTLLDGIMIGGRKVSDQEQILKRQNRKTGLQCPPLRAKLARFLTIAAVCLQLFANGCFMNRVDF